MNGWLAGVDAFVASVEAGSFTAAAERLHLTRSAVAKAVARTEARLGSRLFHRTTRSLAVTEDGQAYYDRCRRAIEEMRAGEAALDSGRREAAGRLRVSAPVLFGRRCVAPALARLTAKHPKLELELSFSDRLVDLVEDGFDLAVRNGPIGPGVGLKARVVSLQRMSVCASPSYLAARGAPQTLDDLASHHAVAYFRSGRVLPWRFPRGGGAPLEFFPSSRMRFDDLEAVADAAEAGHGLSWLPCWLIRDRVRAGALVTLLPDTPAEVFETCALWPETPFPSQRLRVAIDALAAELPGSAEL